MQPEAVLLQKPMDPAQATLANGVHCGDALRRWASGQPGWSHTLHFTGELGYDTPGELDVGFPGLGDSNWGRSGSPKDIHDALGRSIIAMTLNKGLGEATVLVDRGPDDYNPGAQDCEVMFGRVDDILTPDLIAALRFKGYL